MNDEILKYLYDIRESIANIDLHLGNQRNFYVFMESLTIRRAIERELEIIGEAINRILKDQPDIPISYARQIVDLRNRVIHAYDAVDEVIIWRIINKDLPILQKEIEVLLNN